ncbi:hypothetical protein Plec18167_009640 [Paecilomyces lecythidis]|uniref:Methyltransferase domain-containing protein n=1 Tax=Paecilomyces lecythidis TaxID=3004212 RepID=A0ABR3WMI5_9EURO
MASTAYTFGYSAGVLQSHASRTVTNTCGFFLKDVPVDAHVLDAGCGPGTITSSFARVIPKGCIIGIDLSETIVEKARAQDDLPSNCSFQVADITQLPFENDFFDVVYTSQVLSHVPAADVAFKELRRVCKPGGFIACREADATAIMLYPRHPGLELWKLVLPATVEFSNGHKSCSTLLWLWALGAGFTEDQLSLGFGSILYTPKERQFWGETWCKRTRTDTTWRKKAIEAGVVKSDEEFTLIEEGWSSFINDPAAVFCMPCGEIICRK